MLGAFALTLWLCGPRAAAVLAAKLHLGDHHGPAIELDRVGFADRPEWLDRELLLERAGENPFLPKFYENPRAAALPTQLHFLFQRARMLESLRQGDLFRAEQVSDFLVQKDELFARATLDPNELDLYYQVYNRLALDSPAPDLVIYLQAPVEVLLERIKMRGIAAEKSITADYLHKLNEAYARFFHFYDRSPLLIVNAAELDWVNNAKDYKNLVETLLSIKKGRHYYNPKPGIF